jgi:glutathione synthase/RimK-type ligase-like ATP-grasp enzyme
MLKLVVVDNPKDWNLDIPGVEVVSARAYLTNTRYTELKDIRIFNLCRQYKYQSSGYYVSLLAEARAHKAIPSITTIQDFKAQNFVRNVTDDLDELIQKSLGKLKSDQFVLSIYFGQNMAKQHTQLSAQLYNLFQAPLLRAKFVFNKKWILQSIQPIPLNEIPDAHNPYLIDSAKAYFSKKRYSPAKKDVPLYDLAILVNPEEPSPPSNKKAIDKFIEVAGDMGFSVELINKDDYSRLAEFDALFIRETTSVNHHTYRFARRAFAEGLVVIDDPLSILRCTNKVYLAETLAKAKVPIPKTLIIQNLKDHKIVEMLGLPCVLKRPDSSFSQGVIKVKDEKSLHDELSKMLDDSYLVLAQEFTPSEFDWRIGVLDRKPLYACKYFMAKDHWQIYNWENKKVEDQAGNFETMPIFQVPDHILNTALKAANLIGDGLYGVDLKEINNKAYVIEINDNPNIDAGVEDKSLKRGLYEAILSTFKKRIENKRQTKNQ